MLVIPSFTNGYPVTSISGFEFNPTLTSVTIPNGVTAIKGNTFGFCTNLTSLTIDANPTNCADGFWTSSFTNVTFGPEVTIIGADEFAGCTNLPNIIIPNTVTNIGPGAFSVCLSLTNISVAAPNPYYTNINGVLFSSDLTLLVQYPGGRQGSYDVPTGVTSIGQEAFAGCVLTNVTIPGSVTNLGDYAFGYSYFYNFPYAGLSGLYFEGNAPVANTNIFYGSSFYGQYPVAYYYLTNTTGWSAWPPTGAERVLWNPKVQTTAANFGVHGNRYGFNITGPKVYSGNMVVQVEASTNLASPVWIPLSTLTLTNGTAYFGDPNWTNYPTRYYGFSMP